MTTPRSRADEDAPRKGRQLGARCNLDLRKHPEAIATDVDPGVEIWNQPVFAFESIILGQTTEMPLNAASGTVQRVLIEAKMNYADESDSRMYPLQGTPEFSFDSKTYRYWLDLSATGVILGGEWKSFERPDFFWMPNEIAFNGDLAKLSQIYKPAR